MMTVHRVICAAAAMLLSAAMHAQVPDPGPGHCVANCGSGNNQNTRNNNADPNAGRSPDEVYLSQQAPIQHKHWDQVRYLNYTTIRDVNSLLKKSQSELAKNQCGQAMGTLNKAQKLLDRDNVWAYPNDDLYAKSYRDMAAQKQQAEQAVQSALANAGSSCRPTVASTSPPAPPPVYHPPASPPASLPLPGTGVVQRIGAAAAIKGEVYRLTGNVRERITSGMPIFLNDHVTTGPGGRMQVLLLDETVFTVGPDSDMTLDTFVYDPSTSATMTMVLVMKGVFRFVTGKVARQTPEHMKVKLPVGVIGIRGTDFSLKYEPGREGYIKLDRGELEITPDNGAEPFLMEPGQKTVIRADGTIAPPKAPRVAKAGKV